MVHQSMECLALPITVIIWRLCFFGGGIANIGFSLCWDQINLLTLIKNGGDKIRILGTGNRQLRKVHEKEQLFNISKVSWKVHLQFSLEFINWWKLQALIWRKAHDWPSLPNNKLWWLPNRKFVTILPRCQRKIKKKAWEEIHIVNEKAFA